MPCSSAKQVQSAGLGHQWWERCSQAAPFGSCSPTEIFLETRKILSLVSMVLSQLFQSPLLNRSLSNEISCEICCANWSSVYFGSVFLTLATKQAGSDAGASGISEYVLYCWSFLVLKYNGKNQNIFILNHDHQPEWNCINIQEQTGSIMSGEAARFPVDIWEHYFRKIIV